MLASHPWLLTTPIEGSSYLCFNYSSELYSFIQYHSTSLERSHKHDLLTEVDLGVPIDLILPETYSKTETAGKFIYYAVHVVWRSGSHAPNYLYF